MQLRDRFDLPITAASTEAVDDYVAGIDLLLSANPGAEQCLARAVANDPDFALAHIANARLLQLQAQCPRRGRQRRGPKHFATVSRSRKAHRCNRRRDPRLRDGSSGSGPIACSGVSRDAPPLSLALGVFGLLGFSGRLDHHEAQLALLEELAPSHGFFESGDAAGGAGFLEAWLPDYDRAGQLHCHLSWHLALFELARGNSDRARAIYLDSIRPSVAQSAPMLSLAELGVIPVALVAL